jgi:hypothetical protein
MFRIQLIVTGDMEKAALRESLQRLFPDRRAGRGVEWLTPRMVKGVTSHQIRPEAPPSEPMVALAKALLAEARRGKTGQPPDLVVAVDDAEIGNLGREQIVVAHLRAAMTRVLAEQKDENTRLEARALVRSKCSFHLLCPMAESYFFGDGHALIAAGVPASVTPRLVHPTDVEPFETDDPAWLPGCALENQKRAHHTPWWRHERHPKHYLEHLTLRGGVTYDETRQGRTALAGLAWGQIPKCATDTRVVRSLFEDLSAWFNVSNPMPGETHPSLFPTRGVKPDELLLRNL